MTKENNVKNGKQYGCHVDLCEGEKPDGCVLDYGEPNDCIYGRLPSGLQRRSKWTCKQWKPIVDDMDTHEQPRYTTKRLRHEVNQAMANRDARIAELEAEVKRLREQNAPTNS